jgi:hypothetical protein
LYVITEVQKELRERVKIANDSEEHGRFALCYISSFLWSEDIITWAQKEWFTKLLNERRESINNVWDGKKLLSKDSDRYVSFFSYYYWPPKSWKLRDTWLTKQKTIVLADIAKLVK